MFRRQRVFLLDQLLYFYNVKCLKRLDSRLHGKFKETRLIADGDNLFIIVTLSNVKIIVNYFRRIA